MKKTFWVLLIVSILFTSACNQEEEPVATNEQLEVYQDAVSIEQAAKLHCALEVCTQEEELTWVDLSSYITTLDISDYDFTVNAGSIAVFDDGDWEVYMERSGTGDYEFPLGDVPSLGSALDCIEDED